MPSFLSVMARTPLEKILLVVFTLVSMVNLAQNLLWPGDNWYVFSSKVLLMPALAAFLFARTRGQHSRGFLPKIFIALSLSWVGDFVLGLPTQKAAVERGLFIAGMAAFGLAHVFLTWAFLSGVEPRRLDVSKALVTCAPFAVYGYTLYSLVYINTNGHDAALRIPVLLYMLLLFATAISGLLRQLQFDSPSSASLLVGALLLVQSDSIIAIQEFVDTLPAEDFAIMATYILGQFLIVNGCILGPQTATPVREPDRFATQSA